MEVAKDEGQERLEQDRVREAEHISHGQPFLLISSPLDQVLTYDSAGEDEIVTPQIIQPINGLYGNVDYLKVHKLILSNYQMTRTATTKI